VKPLRLRKTPALLLLAFLPLPAAFGGETYGPLNARRAGPARFGIPRAWKRGWARLVRGGLTVGRGRILEGLAEGWCVFEGRVPEGRFLVRRSGDGGDEAGTSGESETGPPFVLEAADDLGGGAPRTERREGVRRFRREGRGPGLRFDMVWIRHTPRNWEGRLLLSLEGGSGELPPPDLRFHGRGPLRLLRGGGLKLLQAPGGWLLRLEGARLRPGDSVRAVFGTGEIEADPSALVLPPPEVLAGFRGTGAAGRPGPRFDAGLRSLFEEAARVRALDPVNLGDSIRVLPGGGRIWAHGEFDLPWALCVLAATKRSAKAWRWAGEAVRHLFGRDLCRRWGGAGGGLRLPVPHGPGHGRGRPDPGHVFLEGSLLFALCTADRELLESWAGVAGDLSSWILGDGLRFRRVRDLAWPLVALCAGLRIRPERKRWRAAAAKLCRLARGVGDPRAFLCRSSKDGGRRIRDLWVEAGLLAPALARAAALGLPEARAALSGWRRSLRGLAKRGGLPLPAYLWVRGKWRPLRFGAGSFRKLWLFEGLRLLRSYRGRVARELPSLLEGILGSGPVLSIREAEGLPRDAATRLAFLLRTDLARAALLSRPWDQRTSRSPPRMPSPRR